MANNYNVCQFLCRLISQTIANGILRKGRRCLVNQHASCKLEQNQEIDQNCHDNYIAMLATITHPNPSNQWQFNIFDCFEQKFTWKMVGIEFVLLTICFGNYIFDCSRSYFTHLQIVSIVCFRHIYCSCDDPRIVGGILAKPGEFKSQVAVSQFIASGFISILRDFQLT